MKRYGEHRFPGKLFVVEGIDGSGKSTQLMLLHQWLQAEGYGVVFSEWNSSPLVRETTKRGKKKQMLTPSTFSLIHATDFADRMEHNILPLLKAGAVVLCDRYIYTAFARDVVRGMDRAVGARALQFRREAHRRVLLPRPSGRCHEAHFGRAQRGEVLRGGDGSGLERGPARRVSASFRAASWMSTRRWFPSST